MIADMVKGIREDLIQTAILEYNLNEGDAEIFVDNFPNESTWADVEETAEALGIDITDVEDDDVENFMSMGGTGKGELESSIGPIQWVYDNKLKAYVVLLMIEENALMYLIDNNMMKDWKASQSMGEYYNFNIRGNKDIESQGESSGVPCGCGPNPCEQAQVDQFKAKYSSVS